MPLVELETTASFLGKKRVTMSGLRRFLAISDHPRARFVRDLPRLPFVFHPGTNVHLQAVALVLFAGALSGSLFGESRLPNHCLRRTASNTAGDCERAFICIGFRGAGIS